MNTRTGAHDLIETLLASGIDTCFANPGTSEMHFVAALDDYPQMDRVLCLFEGVVTGAADGYGRMTGKPAVTLLHLGPGLGNGIANLHNARKAGTGILNVIGDHATFHKGLDAPLNSDIEALAAACSDWVHTSPDAPSLAPDTRDAIAAAQARGIASLILPADSAWSGSHGAGDAVPPASFPQVEAGMIAEAARWLGNGKKTGLVLGGALCHGEGLDLAGRITAHTGATLFAPYATGRLDGGAGRPTITRIPFPVDLAVAMLQGYDQLILLGAREPVAFFAYPGKPSRVVPEDCAILDLADRTMDLLAAAHALVAATGALETAPETPDLQLPDAPDGPLTVPNLCATLTRALRPGHVVIDEGITSTRGFYELARTAPQHDFLINVGGSIGAGLPLTLGAATACKDRPILSLNGDGSASYTLQALWSMQREMLDVDVVICANASYQILKGEMERVGALDPSKGPNPLLELDQPVMDWCAIARGFGLRATRVTTCAELAAALAPEDRPRGPQLIEAVMA
ncbi:acetolactate synthase large subunit [Mesobacterium pallidum]|uniref:acetolactate synthase large subunit n=1 Tax=Mesobacterium pallidum TaxID=2872037 RepID=UPI001EE348E4|nr:acetolactate synthase large subunit [Mesobacterium pallidum]